MMHNKGILREKFTEVDTEYGSLVCLVEKRAPKIPYPKRVIFILCNAFCERFNYYGIRGKKKLFDCVH